VVVDSYVPKRVFETILQNLQYLERVVFIRAGDMPNQQQKSSYFFTPGHYHQSSLPCYLSLNQALIQSKISTLVLEDNILPTPDLAYTIQKHSFLKRLSLAQTTVTDVFAFWMAEALRENNTLEDLNLKQVRWSPCGATVIAEAIRSNQSLLRLDLSETMWHFKNSKDALQRMLQENFTLVELRLNQLRDFPRASPPILSWILKALQNNRTLTSISLSGNHLNQEASTFLFHVLSDHKSLRRIDLSRCCSPDGWGRSLIGLATNSTLMEISLEDCRIGNQGAFAIGKILATNRKIQSIDLCHNNIESNGFISLGEGLKHNQSLERIFLHGNNIDDSSSMIIRDTVRDYNSSLRVIFLPSSYLQKELQYYGSINYAGRKYIGGLALKQPSSLWPLILERGSENPDMLMFLLQQKIDLFQRDRFVKKSSKKRTFDEIVSGS
jgi:Ran GTPase-activating protein (RanGAP) involved in mRNA processing and transport